MNNTSPSAILICGHSGGDWERGLRVIRKFPNVCTDLAGSDPCAGFTEMAVRELGASRVIYGSDVGGRSFASQLSEVTQNAISSFLRLLGARCSALLSVGCSSSDEEKPASTYLGLSTPTDG